MITDSIFQYVSEKSRQQPDPLESIRATLTESMELGISGFQAKSYKPCLNCERHPTYPAIPPVTMHLNGKCLICNSKSSIEFDLKL